MNDTEFLRTLKAKDEIQRALCNYARFQDNKDWEALKQFLTENVRGEYGGVEFTEGRDVLLEMHSRFLDKCGATQHLLGNFRIDVRGERATSACYLRALHAGIGRQTGKIYEVLAEYRDDWVHTVEGWKITKRVEETIFSNMDYEEFFQP